MTKEQALIDLEEKMKFCEKRARLTANPFEQDSFKDRAKTYKYCIEIVKQIER